MTSPVEMILAHQRKLDETNGHEPEQTNALEYLRSIYRNPMEATSTRIRAAVEALPYESPKLPSRVQVTSDFGYRLDRAIEASERAKTVKMIEGSVIETESE